jgi:hypothetical protein
MSKLRDLAFVKKHDDGLYYVWSHRDGTLESEPQWTFAYKSKRKADVEATRLRRVLVSSRETPMPWGGGGPDPFSVLSTSRPALPPGTKRGT